MVESVKGLDGHAGRIFRSELPVHKTDTSESRGEVRSVTLGGSVVGYKHHLLGLLAGGCMTTTGEVQKRGTYLCGEGS